MHRTILEDIQSRWNAAAAAWDPKALARVYTGDAVFFGLLPRLYIGRSEIEEYFGSYQSILEKVVLTLIDQNTRPVGPNAFAAQGFGNILNYNFNGTVSKNIVRSSLVIVEKAGEWQIALHHFSELMAGRNALLQGGPTEGLRSKEPSDWGQLGAM